MKKSIASLVGSISLVGAANADSLTEVMSTDLTASWAGSSQLVNPMAPVGWGYMDPMVVIMDGDQYAPIFYACSATDPNFACMHLVKNGTIVSDVLVFGSFSLPGGVTAAAASQPPMMFTRGGKILVAYWVHTTGGEGLIQLVSFDPAAGSSWTKLSTFDANEPFNYLGGAMAPNGDIVIAGYSYSGSNQYLRVTKVSPPYTSWSAGPGQTVTQYSTVNFQPLYPHVAVRDTGEISILTTLNNGANCSETGTPLTAYKNVVNYEGFYGSTISAVWSNASSDAISSPSTNGDSCYHRNSRFPLDHFYDPVSDATYSIVRREEITDYSASGKLADNANYEVKFNLYKDNVIIVDDLSDLFSPDFDHVNHGTAIDSMSMTRISSGQFVLLANSRGPGDATQADTINPWPWMDIGITWSPDLVTFETPEYLETNFGPGHSVKLAQPTRNGTVAIWSVDFFNSGNLYNPGDVNMDHQYTFWRLILR